LRYAAEVYEKGYGTRLLPAFFLEELFDEGLGLALELAGFAEDLCLWWVRGRNPGDEEQLTGG